MPKPHAPALVIPFSGNGGRARYRDMLLSPQEGKGLLPLRAPLRVLPGSRDADKIAASFTKGVLTVKLPKTAEVQSKEKKIAVTAA